MSATRDRFALRARGHTGAARAGRVVAYMRPRTALEAVRAEELRGRYPYRDRLEPQPCETSSGPPGYADNEGWLP